MNEGNDGIAVALCFVPVSVFGCGSVGGGGRVLVARCGRVADGNVVQLLAEVPGAEGTDIDPGFLLGRG